MNQNNVVSLKGATNLSGKEFRVVTLTANGVDVCASTAQPIGTLIRAAPVQEDGNYLGKAVAVQLGPASVHFCMMGTGTGAIAAGTLLGLDTVAGNEGMLIPGGTVAISVDAFNSAPGVIVRVIFII
jgi:hypothetical protein